MIVNSPTAVDTASTVNKNNSTENNSDSMTNAATMGKDEFLTLLVAQLKNQDPLNPVENTEFTAQMAQFSSLEQLMNINKGVELMTLAAASSSSAQAVNLIGKEITAEGSNVHVTNGVASDISINLPEQASEVTIIVEDANGNVVKTIKQGALGNGQQNIGWTPVDDLGNPLQDGLYTYSVTAKNAAGETMDVSTYTKGIASGVSFENGIAYIHVGDQKVTLSEIIEVREVKEATAPATTQTQPSV